MDIFKGKNQQALQTSLNRMRMYNPNRPSEVNTDGTLQKSKDGVDLIKGGEGSKGGKVIGHTKSGKPIYEHADHPAHKRFTKQEHSDAADAHADHIAETHKKWEASEEGKNANHYTPSEQEEHHWKQGTKHAEAAGNSGFTRHFLNARARSNGKSKYEDGDR